MWQGSLLAQYAHGGGGGDGTVPGSPAAFMKFFLVAAHILLAIWGLAFGLGKRDHTEPLPVPLDDKAVAVQVGLIRIAVTPMLIVGAATLVYFTRSYRSGGSPAAFEDAWHAGTTILAPAVVYWLISLGGPERSGVRLVAIEVTAGVHAALCVPIIVLYLFGREKARLFWIATTTIQAFCLVAVMGASAGLRQHLRACRTKQFEDVLRGRR